MYYNPGCSIHFNELCYAFIPLSLTSSFSFRLFIYIIHILASFLSAIFLRLSDTDSHSDITDHI
uniref:Uncharacterized protein n=1 Tax=Octopus bimaculoides TaxID=37653 RepID=A0A0L8GEZ8_OCTBM